MDRESINNALQREVKPGNIYDKYMPSSDCSAVFLGEGQTDFAVKNMRDWAKKYAHHTEKLAPLFKGRTLSDTIVKIKKFAYDHFQYKLDGATQQIKSPACSWATRYEGIDCKNYSLFVSTLLMNLNITHYFRRIKQKDMHPEHFTHVYVVVPTDQKDLKNGYYTIDGTIQALEELPYIVADDLLAYDAKNAPKNATFASKTHQKGALNAPAEVEKDYSLVERLTATDLDSLISYIEQREQHLAGVLKQRDMAIVKAGFDIAEGGASIASLFPPAAPVAKAIEVVLAVSNIVTQLFMGWFYDPCAGAEYTAKGVGAQLKEEFNPLLSEELAYIQKNVNDNTMSGAEIFINKILKEVDLGYNHYLFEASIHSGNPCSVQALKDFEPFVEKIKAVIDLFVDVIIRSYSGIFKIDIETKHAPTTSRNWYFIVPTNKSVETFAYRQMRFRLFNENLNVKYPYGSEMSFSQWAEKNRRYLNQEYGDSRGAQYIREIMPFADQIRDIRGSVLSSYTSSILRYEQEEEIRKKMIPIYLKYDVRYAEELKKQKDDRVTEYIKNKINFSKDLRAILSKRAEYDRVHNQLKKAKDALTFKKVALGTMGAMGLGLIFKNLV